MYSAVITLFQLLTLDHWNDILEDVSKESDPAFSGIYIILWICIGSFIFRNIFVGIMGKYFKCWGYFRPKHKDAMIFEKNI